METVQVLDRSLDQVVAAIWGLDLAPVKFKLMDAEEGYGWSREAADHNEIEYKRFLTLLAKYPGLVIVPNRNVDQFWHGHILDTAKYAEDCKQVFGHFLHHFPYFGMRGTEDKAELASAASITRELLEAEFGESGPARDASFCGVVNDMSFCGVVNDVSFCGATNTLQAQAESSFYHPPNAALRPDWRPRPDNNSQTRHAR